MGGLGAFCGGKLADHFAKRGKHWNAWVVAWAKILLAPLIFVFYLTDDLTIAICAYIPISFLGAFYLGPTFAMVQSLAPLYLRSMMAAILLFILNLVGLGIGPQAVGLISDWLAPSFGADSVRYALLIVSQLTLWASIHYFLAGIHYRNEIARQPQP